MTHTPNLIDNMRQLAADKHPRAHELRARADELEAAISDPKTSMKKFVGCWARARRLWCECTGEDLV